MAQSLSKIYVHLVFNTKSREPFIEDQWKQELWKYLAGSFKGQKCFARKIGGMSDHVHVLLELHRTVSLSDLAGSIKSESSKWIKRQMGVSNFAW